MRTRSFAAASVIDVAAVMARRFRGRSAREGLVNVYWVVSNGTAQAYMGNQAQECDS